MQDLPAVLAGHYDVERDGVGPEGPGLLEALVAAQRAHHPVARLGEVLPQEIDHVRIIVDGQHDPPVLRAGVRLRSGVRRRLARRRARSRIAQRQGHGEGRPGTRRARDRDVAA